MENKEIIFGRNPVLEYIKHITNTENAILYVYRNAHGKIIETIINSAKNKKIIVEFREKNFLTQFEPSAKHQGVVLQLIKQKEKITNKDFLQDVKQKNGIIVLLDQLTDPHNIGSIIRTTEALGGNGIVLPGARSAEITGTVVKTSAGATAHLPIHTVPNAANFIDNAKKTGFWIIGASDKGNTDLKNLKNIKPAVIIIGSEGSGMRRLTKEKCDYIVRIPLKGKISSLNASVAAGIVIYEALK